MKIIAGMATTGNRPEQLRKAVDSLRMQVDHLYIYNNKMNTDKTDLGKFYGLSLLTEPCIYFSVDDDIIYPEDYVARTVQHLKRLDFEAIVTYHGRKLKGPGLNYYHGHESFACWRRHMDQLQIDVPGTGVCAFHTDYFNDELLHETPVQRAADLVLGIRAAELQKKVIHLPHPYGWIVMQPVQATDTCYYNESKNPDKLTALADKIWRLNYQPQKTT